MDMLRLTIKLIIVIVAVLIIVIVAALSVATVHAQDKPATPKAKVKAKARARLAKPVPMVGVPNPPPAWYKPPVVKGPLKEDDSDTWPVYHVSDPAYYNRMYNQDRRPVPPAWYAAYRALRRVQPVSLDRIEHYAPIDAEIGSGEQFYRHPGWWLGIENVQPGEDGSLDILVNAMPLLSARTVPVQIQPQYLETYRLAPNGTLEYLGGRPLYASPDGKAHLHYAGKPTP
jgi:hypothetical protein